MGVSQLNITPELFDRLRSFREFQNILNDLDISDEDQLDLFDTLDVDGGGTIDLEEFIVGLSKLRGEARRSDIIGVNLIVRSIQSMMSRLVDCTTEQSQILQSYSRQTAKLQQAQPVHGSARASPHSK